MKKKLTLLLGVLLCSAMLFAACGGGAPGYISSPPENPDDLVTQMKGDGWENAKKGTEYDGLLKLVAVVNGMKTNIDMSKIAADILAGTLSESDKIEMETAVVLYFEDEEAASANYEVFKKDAEDGNKAFKDAGLSVSTNVSRKGKIVSNYAKVSGTIKQYMDAVTSLGD